MESQKDQQSSSVESCPVERENSVKKLDSTSNSEASFDMFEEEATDFDGN